ncbi:MAG TPA: hypothetical protein VK631_18290 [Solirubrobacteraceae bacterium]|nr:hypothetical protein [Solirubrobacteraceae bacterium]
MSATTFEGGSVRRVEPGGEVVAEPREQVPVLVERHRDRLVARDLLNRLRVRALRDEQRRHVWRRS